jgi:cystathionine beta-lyase
MKDDTKVVVKGRDPANQYGAVNPPVVHASTILFKTVDEFNKNEQAYISYGRHGHPSGYSLRDAMADLEGGYKSLLTCSGLSSVTTVILSFVGAGDHLLMVDSVYGPTRTFCDETLKRLGVETTYYDPSIGAGIEELIKPNTKLIFMETPGSRTFEIQDVPAIVAVAKAKGGITTAIDNTWATPLYFKPFDFGVDVSVHAATKYIVGHSDAMLGVMTANESSWNQLYQTNRALGGTAAPDDAYLGQRGLRTLSVRMQRHRENAESLISFLLEQPEVSRILYPSRPEDPGHEIWKRDFTGASGLFGIVFNQGTVGQSTALLETLEYFGMGFSYGGYESLMVPIFNVKRTVNKWSAEGPTFRISAGLEDPNDLIEDLERGFHAFRSLSE